MAAMIARLEALRMIPKKQSRTGFGKIMRNSKPVARASDTAASASPTAMNSLRFRIMLASATRDAR